MSELVSIIVPVYNSAPYLNQNIESILNQSHRELEILYIDDGSQDDSGTILRKYAASDGRIRVIRQENHGVSHARNTGLNAATGRYITFVDADDHIESGYVEQLLEGIRREGADISCCGFMLHRPDRSIPVHGTGEKYIWGREEALEQLITGSVLEPGVWGKLFRAELLREVRFETGIRYNEDYLFNLMVFPKAEKTVFQDLPLYNYVLHANSATTNPPVLKRAEDLVRVAEMSADTLQEGRLRDILVRKQYMGYLGNYNSLLYDRGAEISAYRKQLRKKICGSKQYYRAASMNKKELFYYAGICYCPFLYKYVYKLLKRLMPDRRTFKI